MWKLYRYTQSDEELKQLAELNGETQPPNVAEYIADDQGEVRYYRINDGSWQESKGEISLLFDDPALKPVKDLTEDEAKQHMFLENV